MTMTNLSSSGFFPKCLLGIARVISTSLPPILPGSFDSRGIITFSHGYFGEILFVSLGRGVDKGSFGVF